MSHQLVSTSCVLPDLRLAALAGGVQAAHLMCEISWKKLAEPPHRADVCENKLAAGSFCGHLFSLTRQRRRHSGDGVLSIQPELHELKLQLWTTMLVLSSWSWLPSNWS